VFWNYLPDATGDHAFMKNAAFKSDFAILDVKGGRAALKRRIHIRGPELVRVDLVLNTVIDNITSARFSDAVQAVKEFKTTDRVSKAERPA
jgi:hypothetical protein